MRLDGKTNPRRATKLKIGHLSAVDVPAHEGAEVKVIKARVLTKEDNSVEFEPMLKSAFSDALSARKLSEKMDKLWPLNGALHEAAEKIAKDDAIVDKQSAMLEAVNEYLETIRETLTGEPLAKATSKTEDGKAFPAGDYAYVPDAEKPSEWKLRLTSTPGGDPDPAIVGAAAAALGAGFRGQKVEIPDADRAAVVARVRSAWVKANPDKKPEEMPEGIRKQEEADMDLKKYKALAEMTDVQKAHYNGLSEQDQTAFIEMAADEREACVKACATDEEQFTADDGTVVAKSKVGDAVYKVLRSQQEQISKQRDDMEMEAMKKRAGAELSHLPGELTAKAKALRAINGLQAEDRDCVVAMLKAGDDASKAGFKPAAADGEGEDLTAEQKLDKMAGDYAAEHNVTKSKAYVEVMRTEAGRKLYEEADNHGN